MLRNSALLPFLVTASLSLFFFSGCAEKNADGTTKKKERILPPSSGTHSELLLVMPDANFGKVPREKSLEHWYLADVEGLPQAEAYFDASRVEPQEVNKILQKTKSILWVEKSDTCVCENAERFVGAPATDRSYNSAKRRSYSEVHKRKCKAIDGRF